mmetsp:Transcript_5471/g.21633  ORF Transcript_5471/g.21633 Transcript_5471/m.21633 type:complete len:248 (-) Transcript_5471:90-833(-)
MARRFDTTSFPSSGSTCRNLTRKVLPTRSSLSSVDRCEPGMKPRMPSTSTRQPPRFVPSTVASMTTSSAWYWIMRSQASRNSICLMETSSWPETWSSPMTSNSRSSPMLTTFSTEPTERRPASFCVSSAVDLAPISTRAPSGSICTTEPVTRSPRTKRRRVSSKMFSKSSYEKPASSSSVSSRSTCPFHLAARLVKRVGGSGPGSAPSTSASAVSRLIFTMTELRTGGRAGTKAWPRAKTARTVPTL